MTGLCLEIVEGPDAGRQLALRSPVVIGRAGNADLALDDKEVSRLHARVSPSPEGEATVEDIGSSNGTFLNAGEVHGATRMYPGDELLLGVTVLTLRTAEDVAARPSTVRVAPPALAVPERSPQYVAPVGASPEKAARIPGGQDLERLLDANVRFRAFTAPLAVFVLVALIVAVYLGAR